MKMETRYRWDKLLQGREPAVVCRNATRSSLCVVCYCCFEETGDRQPPSRREVKGRWWRRSEDNLQGLFTFFLFVAFAMSSLGKGFVNTTTGR